MRKAFTLVLLAVAIMIVGVSCDDPKHEHSYSTEWKYDDTNHWHECSCGAKINEAAHTNKEDVVKAATCVDAGSKKTTCSVCGREVIEEIAALGHDFGTDGKCSRCGNTKAEVDAAVARIGLKYYASFKDAVHDAQSSEVEGNTVEVLVKSISIESHEVGVNGSVTINANGCDFQTSGSEHDLAIFQYENKDYLAVSTDDVVNIVINGAKNLKLWGTLEKVKDGQTVNIEVNNCEYSAAGNPWIMLRGDVKKFKGTFNLKVSGCNVKNLRGVYEDNNVAVYNNLATKIEIVDCTFKNVRGPLNITSDINEGSTIQKCEVIIDHCVFDECGDGDSAKGTAYMAPIRIRNSDPEGRNMTVTIKNCTITNTKSINTLGDVTLVDPRSGRKWKAVTAVFENNNSDMKVMIAGSGSDNEFTMVKAGETITLVVEKGQQPASSN